MDLNYSAEELSFRDQVRGWLAANLPKDLREKVSNYEHLSREDLLKWHRILASRVGSRRVAQEWGGTD